MQLQLLVLNLVEIPLPRPNLKKTADQLLVWAHKNGAPKKFMTSLFQLLLKLFV